MFQVSSFISFFYVLCMGVWCHGLVSRATWHLIYIILRPGYYSSRRNQSFKTMKAVRKALLDFTLQAPPDLQGGIMAAAFTPFTKNQEINYGLIPTLAQLYAQFNITNILSKYYMYFRVYATP